MQKNVRWSSVYMFYYVSCEQNTNAPYASLSLKTKILGLYEHGPCP